MQPKLFISYSWTSPDHEAWVVDLATELRQAGVDVILDKWDLREGQDANVFMEKMVADPEVRKVAMICDRAYSEKANARKGGVGTESQIISAEVYKSTDQNKFVAIVKERDESGHAFLPTYYAARIYIDLSDSSSYAVNFEQLLRWVYDQPVHQKPPLGQKPAFLSESAGAVQLGTSLRHKRALDAIKNARPFADGAVDEYFDCLAEEMERLRINDYVGEFDDAVVRSVETFLPYRNEAIEIFVALAQYRDTPHTRKALHRFFETVIPYLDRPTNAQQWSDWSADNFHFVIHELFLYGLAALTKHERFEAAAHMLQTPFYLPSHLDRDSSATTTFEIFRTFLKSIERRNERLGTRRLSLRADLLKDRSKGVGLTFQHVMQADFLLYLYSQLHHRANWRYWWPESLLYACSHARPFELFVRARSGSYFENIRVLLDVPDKESLGAMLNRIESSDSDVPRWQYERIRPRILAGYDGLASMP